MGCLDVRTSGRFAIAAASVSAEGVVSQDSAAVTRLCVGAMHAIHSVAASDEAGGAYVCWVESAGEDCDLRLQRVDAEGAIRAGWPAGGLSICATPGSQVQPALVPAAGGGAVVAWTDYRDARAPAVYIQRVDGAGALVSGSVANGVPLVRSPAPQSDPVLVRDAAGSAWVLWQEGSAGARKIRALCLAADLHAAAGWPEAGRSVSENADDNLCASGVQAAGGGIYVGWQRRSPGTREIRILKLGPDGAPAATWPGEGVSFGASALEVRLAGMSADLSGLYACWLASAEDSALASDSTDARLVRVEASGQLSPGWSGLGLRLGGTIAEPSDVPRIAPDGEGGVYAVWTGRRTEADAATRLGRYRREGGTVAGWNADGVLISNEGGDEHRPRVLAAQGGAIVTWASGDAAGTGVMLGAGASIQGALPALHSARAWPDLVELRWTVPEPPRYALELERRRGAGEWELLGSLVPSAEGALAYDDRDVSANEHLSYRVRIVTGSLIANMPGFEVVVPAAAPFLLRDVRVAEDQVLAQLSLPGRTDARLELFDVQGRRVFAQTIRAEHAGEQDHHWGLANPLHSGIYFARLTQARESRTRRLILAR